MALPGSFLWVGISLPSRGSLVEAPGLAESEFIGNRCGGEQKQVIWLLLQKPLKLTEFSGKDQTDR